MMSLRAVKILSVNKALTWSPDGDRFVFSGYQGDSPEFWLMKNFLPLVKVAK